MTTQVDLIEVATPPYPALLWFGRRCIVVAVAARQAATGGGPGLAYAWGQPLWMSGGRVVAVAMGFLLRLLVKIVHLPIETLIPR